MSKFGIMVKNNRSEARNRRAFTLVELIIAVTILAILATIAFLNLSGYTGDTRDSVRYTDLRNIQKTMDLNLAEWRDLPIPDNVKSGTVEISEIPWEKWQEWLFWEESIKSFSELNSVPLDPSKKTKYRYLVSEDRKFYYLEAELENGEKYTLTNYDRELALNSVPNTPKTPTNPTNPTTPTNPTPPVTPPVTPDKDKYTPIWQTINATVWTQVNPGDWIQNKGDLPSTTTYRWKTPIDTTTPWSKTWTIEVVYPDWSIDEVSVEIKSDCSWWHTKVWNACKVNTQNCTVANWTWTQALQANGTYGACTVNTCNANFHKEWNTCVSNTKTCTASNGTWTQTWTWNAWWACTVDTCNTGYTKVWNECKKENSKPTVSWVTWETTVAVWQQINLTINGADSDWDTLTYKSTNLPSGLTISWNKITWTRNTAWEVTFQVVASDGKVDSDPINIKVDFLLVGEMRLTYSGITNWETITLPYHWNVKIISIDWGDGWVNKCITNPPNAYSLSCVYTNASKWTYTIIVKWNASWFWNKILSYQSNKIINITDWNKMWITDLSYAFSYARNFNQPLNNFDTSKITNMEWMFIWASNFNQPLNNWNTWKVTNMSHMFSWATKFNQPLNNWNVSNVTNMSDMFSWQINFNQPLNNWNTWKVTNMSRMFYASKFNQNINSWDVSNVTNMKWMFNWAINFNQPLNNWNTWKVTNMESMFSEAKNFNQNINSWNVSNVTNMSEMFKGSLDYREKSSFNQPLNNWNVSNVTDMSSMFDWAIKFNQNINSWNVSNVINMRNMFDNAVTFNQPLNNWNTWKVTDIQEMFNKAEKFNQNISNWNLPKVTSCWLSTFAPSLSSAQKPPKCR